MGSYHSYVGDAKLEDSKDNWYRISGLGLSNRNFNTSEQENNAGDNYSFSLISKGVSSTILFKAVNGFATRNQAFLTKIPNMVVGREFIIKDRSNGMDDILPFNGKLDSSGVQTLGKTFIKDNIGNRIFIISMDNDRLRGTLPDQADLQTALRPMLTIKPKGGEVLEHFTLKIKITRRFTTPNGPQMYRISFIPEVIEGNPSIIKEAIYKFGIGRNGEDLPDGTYSITNAAAQAQEQALLPGEVTSHEAPHGVVNAAGGIGALYKLINGKYLYIKQLNVLPGMEQPWPDNGGIATAVVTFTEADAYTI